MKTNGIVSYKVISKMFQVLPQNLNNSSEDIITLQKVQNTDDSINTSTNQTILLISQNINSSKQISDVHTVNMLETIHSSCILSLYHVNCFAGLPLLCSSKGILLGLAQKLQTLNFQQQYSLLQLKLLHRWLKALNRRQPAK
jgi:hypothetical protein